MTKRRRYLPRKSCASIDLAAVIQYDIIIYHVLGRSMKLQSVERRTIDKSAGTGGGRKICAPAALPRI